MDINISQLSGLLKKIAIELDEQGNRNSIIDAGELSVFKATSAFLVRRFKASDIIYTSLFGQSAFSEWKETHSYYSKNKGETSEYKDTNGNIIRGSIDKKCINVYSENSKGEYGFYSKEIIVIPELETE